MPTLNAAYDKAQEALQQSLDDIVFSVCRLRRKGHLCKHLCQLSVKAGLQADLHLDLL